MADFQPFQSEHTIGIWEQSVEYNLTVSGVHPVVLRELLADDPDQIDDLLDTSLNYPHVEGIPQLRQNIAALYNGAEPENIFVTVGAIEANYISINTLLDPGDEIAIMLPNYLQIWGIAKNCNLKINTFRLREDDAWSLDIDELTKAVTPNTKLIAICNPNNPTGHILTEDEMNAIIATAEKVGAWILSDEVYTGTERLTDDETPSFYGRYDKVLAIGSLSKAYGMPGLRLGWVAGPVEALADIVIRHEYITICATMLSNKLAAIATSPEVRPRIIQRTRDRVRQGYIVLEKWLENHTDTLSLTPPQATGVAFIRYNHDIDSTAFADRLRIEKSVLLVAGELFGIDRFLRVGFGIPEEKLTPALERLHDFIVALDG